MTMKMSFAPCLSEYKGGTLLHLYVQPGASKTSWDRLFGDPPRIKLRIKSPPVDGAANDEVVRFLAETFGLKKSSVEIVRGEKSRQKDVWLLLPQDQIEERLTSVWPE